jgi:hypothetical protein
VPSTPAETSQVTIKVTSGSITQTTVINVTVNKQSLTRKGESPLISFLCDEWACHT